MCKYKTDKKFNLDRHLQSEKHKRLSISNSNDRIYSCFNCNKKFLSRNGIWCHKKICGVKESNDNKYLKIISELQQNIMNQNEMLLNILSEKCLIPTTSINFNNIVTENNENK